MDDIEGADPSWADTPSGTEKILAMARALRERVDSDSRLAAGKIGKWLSAQHRMKSAEKTLPTDKAEPDPDKIAKSFEDMVGVAEAEATLGEFRVHLAKANALLATAMVRRMNADEEGARAYRAACKAALASVKTLVIAVTTCRRVYVELRQLDSQEAPEVGEALKYAQECRAEIGFWAWRFRR